MATFIFIALVVVVMVSLFKGNIGEVVYMVIEAAIFIPMLIWVDNGWWRLCYLILALVIFNNHEHFAPSAYMGMTLWGYLMATTPGIIKLLNEFGDAETITWLIIIPGCGISLVAAILAKDEK